MAMLIALILVTWANSAPVLARILLGRRWGRPIDGGRVLRDGWPLLGASKTWRGWAASGLSTPILAGLLGLSWLLGLVVSAGAMLGDAGVSFIKRRMGLPASASAPVLDQVPEALIPALVLMPSLSLSLYDLLSVVVGFLLIDVALTPVAHHIGRRARGLHP